MEAAESERVCEFVVRRAVAQDAQAIGAVFDAAVRAGWTFLGDLAQRPMLSAQDWERLVTDHAPSDAILVATDAAHGVIGYAAVHSEVARCSCCLSTQRTPDAASAARCWVPPTMS